jgi:hypothetical protein
MNSILLTLAALIPPGPAAMPQAPAPSANVAIALAVPAATAGEVPADGPSSDALADVPGWFWTYVPDVVWEDWREIVA